MIKFALWATGLGVAMSLLMQGATTALPDSHKSSAAPGAPSAGIQLVTTASATRAAANEVAATYGETVIGRDYAGHFNLNVTVNGQQVPFLVDTGADTVTLTVETARALGLYVDENSFETIAMGAGGPVRGARMTIDRLEIGTRSLTGVSAMVLEGLTTNLLGQSALSQLGGVEMRGDQMVLR